MHNNKKYQNSFRIPTFLILAPIFIPKPNLNPNVILNPNSNSYPYPNPYPKTNLYFNQDKKKVDFSIKALFSIFVLFLF